MHEQTFDDVYRKHARALLKYIARVTGDASLAEDILQKTFFRFLESSAAPKEERQMKNYLFKIATNLITDHWRGTKRFQRFLGLAEPRPHSIADNDLRTDVRATFSTLKPQERSLLWLAYVEGCSHAEIAQILALQEGSVKVLLFRARAHLAAALEEKGLTAEVFA